MAIDFIKEPTQAQKKPRGYDYWKPGMAVEDKPPVKDIRADVESMRKEEMAAHPDRDPASLPRTSQTDAMKEAIEGKPIKKKRDE